MRRLLAFCFVAAFVPAASALEPESGSAFVRIVDVGAGLCCVAVVPGADRTHYMVYDAGTFADAGATAEIGIGELIPTGSVIDLMVISHSDADHLKAVPFVCENYHVHRFLRPRYDRTRDETFGQANTASWRDADAAILAEVRENIASALPTVDYALDRFVFPTDVDIPLGEGAAKAVFGLHVPPPEWGFESASEKSKRRNAGSIVVRLEFAGRSVLFTGDTVGRQDDSPSSSIIAAEEAMLDGEVELDSDVLVAPHHGADNGSSSPFIAAIDPEFVIFSAGHDHEHPRASTAERYLDHGVDVAKMLRTDLGDNEGDDEWEQGATGFADAAGDDDVDVLIRPNGQFFVAYRDDSTPSPTPSPSFAPRIAGAPRAFAGPADRRFDEIVEDFRSVRSLRATDDRSVSPTPSEAPAAIVIHIENLTIENLTLPVR